jgi:hypothetical protein
MNRTDIYMKNRINAIVQEFIESVAEAYNSDWFIPSKKYLDVITDTVNKQLKQLKKEMNEE